MVVRGSLALLVLVLCAAAGTALAQATFSVPPGFTKQAATDAEVTRVRGRKTTVALVAVAYVKGDVRLTRIEWKLKLDSGVSRDALEQLDQELIDQSQSIHHVSDTRLFDDTGMQLLTEVFDETKAVRVYHRRLYGLDDQGVVHVFWLICRGPATQIGDCEKAQRTMQLVVPGEVVVPAVAKPTSPSAPWPTSADPWTFVLPKNYYEEDGGPGEKLLAKMREKAEKVWSDARVFSSPDQVVHLIASFRADVRPAPPTWEDVDGFDRILRADVEESPIEIVSSSGHREGDLWVTDITAAFASQRMVRRDVFAVDRKQAVHSFFVMCVGPKDRLSECQAALQTMRPSFRPVAPITPPWSVTIPDGYLPYDDGSEAEAEDMRHSPDISLLDLHMYETADHEHRIVVNGMVGQLDHTPTWNDLEEGERQTVASTRKNATKHLSASTSRNGLLLIGTQTDEVPDRRTYRRVYGIDTSNRVYMFSVMCVGVELAECTKVEQSMRLEIPNQVAPANAVGRSAMYKGWTYELAAMLVLLAVVIALVLRVTGRKRRGRRARGVARR